MKKQPITGFHALKSHIYLPKCVIAADGYSSHLEISSQTSVVRSMICRHLAPTSSKKHVTDRRRLRIGSSVGHDRFTVSF
ncbi:uncharacterized protein MYCGRDRAFT_81585 [Zymoseptoria tritici IPO323]|uniref:Uncharacterized protein n=1 Tax=Zymoseptoria tritici (strain CBS 115943 / IPO323) TaxID=336722 RepID=F9XFT3_ZYMTI|nr:uncharacterized protein MYCGRDRAFT_81585 [Zymoseptoria tritici IPO323]EGP86129.1 hypothetical protein MYCGRDRAFT_81585 [Zymoseptoria tritici IPO323]